MPVPAATWKYVFDQAPEVTGSGGTMTASAVFEIAIGDRNEFINSACGLTSGGGGWPLPQIPWDCPFQPVSGLLCSGFKWVPFGLRDSISGSDNTVDGHYDFAHVTLNFERPKYDYEYPSSQNQIDTSQPILFCEQTIETHTRTVTVPGYELEYVGAPATEKPVGPVVKFAVQADYVLNFPFVPYIPWNFLEPFHECVNDRVLFGKARGTIRFSGASIKNEVQSNGVTRTSCVLKMSYNAIGWNMQMATNGLIYELKIKNSANRIYKYANLAGIWS